ncbi:lytic transglycosylase domain-containing protein [Pararhizobium antarcticum]|uniref:Lytic transglycosylase n=1 Tax=Pararhizobium antarcticum TaxID=1798805 RepID=A0A657LSK1_9HYPH|nr:lytic transglycosylase domain-containing protein [Pararhizobium antarcticum]OJF97320.1 lytic transglycosylase [Pararhizobium antarcticum]OJG00327.1 lytic transglycosylase [Rhizobium sp. 58]
MAKIGFSNSKHALTACALITASFATGCSSVERTPMEQLMAAQSVTPLAKPGTELTAYALPTPDGTPTASVAALAAETAMMQPAENAANGVATAQLQPANAAATSALPVTANAMVETRTTPVPQMQTTMVAMAAMDSDFDTGEPVGLETLVASRMIVPVAKPVSGAAVAYANGVATPAAFGVTEKLTSSRPELDRLISFYAKLNGLPEALVHRVVKRESTYNPRAYSKGNYGLMQIRYNTAKGLGYDGTAEGLFDAETNLKYATKYLRGAWMVADNQNDNAVKLYASGYYYHAKRKGLLEELGMK